MLCAFIFSAVRMTPGWSAALCRPLSSISASALFWCCVLILNRARAPELHAGALFQVLNDSEEEM